VRGAGRTDAGVHALGQVAAVRVEDMPPDLDRLRASLNALLPHDIVVSSIAPADDAFSPRRDATSRVYEYRLWTAPAPSPFWRRFAWHCWGPLDLDAMQDAAAALVGTHDFRSFCAADADATRSTVRRVHASRFERREELLVYRIEANAFLKHMVRNVMGTLIEIGRGVRPAESMPALLRHGDRRAAGPTAPPHGLVLLAVRYDGTTDAPTSDS
jgi:tRNA pseudouridine38-40 synthase